MECKFLLSAMFLIFIVGLYIPDSYSQNPCPGISTVDYAGKTYNTIAIGNQCWLKENLNIGTILNSNQNQSNNNITEKTCYLDDSANCTTYGGLYQWNEAMQYVTTPGSQGICPTGWHIPTYAEFITLATTVGNDGNALKAIGQGTGTNTSGFSALLAGYRCGGSFDFLGNNSYFWSSTEFIAAGAYDISLDGTDSGIGFNYGSKVNGFSVRCAKD